MATDQSVNSSARNINLIINTDYPNFDLLINGKNYETYTQNRKTSFNGNGSNRSYRYNKEISDSDSLQRAIRDNLRQKNQRFSNIRWIRTII